MKYLIYLIIFKYNANLNYFYIAALIDLYINLQSYCTSTYPILETMMGVNSTDHKKWVRDLYIEGENDGSVQRCHNLGKGPN